MTKKTKKNHIWEGIYKSFKEAPTIGSGFSSDIWKKNSLAKIKRILKLAKGNKTVPEFVIYRENLLPILAILVPKSKVISIIDFGGNLGQEFVSILHSIDIKSKNIKYTVVENKDVCEVGNKLFKNDKRIQFMPNLPSSNHKVDIIHIGSTLQYIENWKDLFKKLVKFKPLYILFTDLQAGNIPTYVTSQNYYDSKMPVWFFNISDIVKELNKLGYKLTFRSTYRGSFFGKEGDMPQLNLPKKFQLKNSCNLLFIRK